MFDTLSSFVAHRQLHLRIVVVFPNDTVATVAVIVCQDRRSVASLPLSSMRGHIVDVTDGVIVTSLSTLASVGM